MGKILNKIGTSDQINHQDEMNLGSWHGLVSFLCNWSKIYPCIFKWCIWYQYIFQKSLIFKKKQLFVHFGNHLGWFHNEFDGTLNYFYYQNHFKYFISMFGMCRCTQSCTSVWKIGLFITWRAHFMDSKVYIHLIYRKIRIFLPVNYF